MREQMTRGVLRFIRREISTDHTRTEVKCHPFQVLDTKKKLILLFFWEENRDSAVSPRWFSPGQGGSELKTRLQDEHHVHDEGIGQENPQPERGEGERREERFLTFLVSLVLFVVVAGSRRRGGFASDNPPWLILCCGFRRI